MKFTLQLFIADNRVNEWMEKLDVRHPDKYFVYSMNISFERDVMDEDFIMKLINDSKDTKAIDGKWIAAIGFGDTLYTQESVRCLGFMEQGKECFIP